MILNTYEALKTFGYVEVDELGNTSYKEEAFELGKKIFKVIKNCIDNFVLDKNYKINIEQVPKMCGHMAV